MQFETITYEKQGRKAIVTFNRPSVLNALNMQMSEDLYVAWSDFREDPELWVAILTGAGDRAFSVGADLKQAAARTAGPASQPRRNIPPGGITRNANIWKPMIAAVNGYCLGAGLEMALACDIRVAADHAQFGLPEPRWSLIAAAGGTTRLPRSIPKAVAMKMLLTGERIDARQALQWGLVTDIVPLGELMPLAHRIADTILENAPLSVRAAKEIAIRTADMPLEDGLVFESALARNLQTTEDRKEGPRAFAEKRKPQFKGR